MLEYTPPKVVVFHNNEASSLPKVVVCVDVKVILGYQGFQGVIVDVLGFFNFFIQGLLLI